MAAGRLICIYIYCLKNSALYKDRKAYGFQFLGLLFGIHICTLINMSASALKLGISYRGGMSKKIDSDGSKSIGFIIRKTFFFFLASQSEKLNSVDS